MLFFGGNNFLILQGEKIVTSYGKLDELFRNVRICVMENRIFE
jgi:hypothetical protein